MWEGKVEKGPRDKQREKDELEKKLEKIEWKVKLLIKHEKENSEKVESGKRIRERKRGEK